MSRLKSQIRQTEAEINANHALLQQQYKAFAENPNTPKLMACAVTCAVGVGYLIGRHVKISLRTARFVSFKAMSTFRTIAVIKSLMEEKIKPRR
jgi:hypothetical protein